MWERRADRIQLLPSLQLQAESELSAVPARGWRKRCLLPVLWNFAAQSGGGRYERYFVPLIEKGKKMPQVLLFHHAQGQTPGFLAFAEELRQAGHTVHIPDLYEGRTCDTLGEGIAHAQSIGFDTIIQRGQVAAAKLPDALVYAGFSLGVMPAQMLAQTRPGAKGALLFHACIPASEFGSPWPEAVPLQIHAMEADEFFVNDGDLDAAQRLVETVENAELYLYPGDQHLFADASLPSYDKNAATLLKQRVLRFLENVQISLLEDGGALLAPTS